MQTGLCAFFDRNLYQAQKQAPDKRGGHQPFTQT
jgi:hypothetical protein